MRSINSVRRAGIILAAAIAGSVWATASSATPVYVATNTDFSSAPTTISLDGGAATYTFTYIGSGYDPTADAVMTGGNGLVNSFVFLGNRQIIGFEPGSQIGGNNGYPEFTAFPAAEPIPYSLAEDFIGLEFTLADGNHFGYAEVAGPTLIGYGYDDVPNTPISAIDVNGAVTAAAPEPLTVSMFLAGLLLIGGIAARRRKNTTDGLNLQTA